MNIERFNGHQRDINLGFIYPWLTPTLQKFLLFYGYPREKASYYNLILAFPTEVWLLLMLVIVAFILLLNVILLVYRDILCRNDLVKSGIKKWDIVLKVVSTLTEPDSFDYFPVWSTGNVCVGVQWD